MHRRDIPIIALEDFSRLAEGGRALDEHPWVIEGFVDQWPAREEWTDLAHLADVFGDQQVRAAAPQFSTDPDVPVHAVETSFGDYLAYLAEPSRAGRLFEGKWVEGSHEGWLDSALPLYCGTVEVAASLEDPVLERIAPRLPPGICDHGPHIPFFFETYNHFWLYVSNAGALTPLHFDNNAVGAYLAQLEGLKRATLFSPADESRVRTTKGGKHAWLDPENVDTAAFPGASEATAWEAELRPGQLLIWGGKWSHHVRTLEPSITVSYDFIYDTNLPWFVDGGPWLESMGRVVAENLVDQTSVLSFDGTGLSDGASAALTENLRETLLESLDLQSLGRTALRGIVEASLANPSHLEPRRANVLSKLAALL